MLRSTLFVFLVVVVCLATPEFAQPVQQDESIKERVKPSIEAGLQFLRASQTRLGTWAYNGQTNPNNEQVVGATALCGIALMECGAAANDKQVQAAAGIVRKATSDPKFTYTYSVCLSLLFLDRLNRDKGLKHSDVGTISRLANMLIAGQTADGRWGYNLPSANADGSNTQFGVVALWVARKYFSQGGRIDKALGLTEDKLRKSQGQDGSWNYDQTGISFAFKPTGSMTCAGILGIALSAGAKQQQQQTASFRGANSSGTVDVIKNLDADRQIVAARTFILSSLQQHVSGSGQPEGHVTYFFWSLERVATLYRWRKINGVDWFELGATYLMKKQVQNGSWEMEYLHGPNVDTSFALLFLAKSNLLGSLQEADFTNGSIGTGPVIAKTPKKPEPSKTNATEYAKGLLEKLLTALPDKQAQILDELTEGKGIAYSEALVEAIEKLSTNAGKEAAREALANRFKRLTSKALTENMQNADREVRLAAVVAVRLKNDLGSAGGAIPLLADQDVVISTAALETLKAISRQDFGKSVDRWSRWLDNNNLKKP